MQTKKLHICVIDDGVCDNDISLYQSIQINNGVLVSSFCKYDDNSHGTACAKVIDKHVKKEILISSVSILDEHDMGSVDALCLALEWCIKNKVDIVNVSLGSTFFKDKTILRNKVNQCIKAGIVIVAASSNVGYTTYPASFTNVIGVQCYDQIEKKDCIVRYDTNLGFGIFQTYGSEKLYINGKEKTTQLCNSIAAPYVVSKIINMFYHEITPIEIRNAFGKEVLEFNCFDVDWVMCAYVVDIPDLIYSMCDFDIVSEGKKSLGFADTVIMRGEENLDEWINEGKNVIYVGNKEINHENNKKYVWSKYNRIQQINYNQKSKCREIDVPVIFIQGKYALKYIYGLSKFMLERNYHAYKISHNVLYELYGIKYIPLDNVEGYKINNFINNELYYKQGDILLYDISEVDQGLAEKYIRMSPDIIIEADEIAIFVSSEQEIKKKQDSIEAVGEYILNLLTKE